MNVNLCIRLWIKGKMNQRSRYLLLVNIDIRWVNSDSEKDGFSLLYCWLITLKVVRVLRVVDDLGCVSILLCNLGIELLNELLCFSLLRDIVDIDDLFGVRLLRAWKVFDLSKLFTWIVYNILSSPRILKD